MSDDIQQDDEPFGSSVWQDEKYMISIMIPIGISITGAMIIMIMAYAGKMCKKRREEVAISTLERVIPKPLSSTVTLEDVSNLISDTDDEEY
ncbi:hypothetical protein SNE40_010099 [Patella caerulea]|uniref:Uncharacterized protein n=1 Tax=Patella caerulea TaxID=87958 RepID=A0AAN8PZH5_PATCE